MPYAPAGRRVDRSAQTAARATPARPEGAVAGDGSCRHLDVVAEAGVVLVDRGEDALERGGAAERAAAVVDVRLELVAELVDVARDRDRIGVSERAEALAEDPVADREQQVELALVRAPVLDLVED